MLLYPVDVVGLRRAGPARILTLAGGSELSAEAARRRGGEAARFILTRLASWAGEDPLAVALMHRYRAGV
ncbi:hypothetical protein BOQ63_014880 [Streptomyces viridifaciens]|nr:hypothetical protein CP971_08005 [Streptomyces viridifaciens]UKZ05303.1 hypothetical protein BOQ63_014880 [Streptomyces viridifaciens]